MSDYTRLMRQALALLRHEEVEAAHRLLREALDNGRGVYICGNGGSASTASHFAVDLGKNLHRLRGPRMRVVSLTDNVAWLTAVANDEDYADCFSEQLRNYLQPNDLVVGISASGDSENVVRAFQLAQDMGAERLALIGFDGGRLAQLATVRVWIDSHDYGIVESVHLFVAHQLVAMLTHGERASETSTPVETPGRQAIQRQRVRPAADVPVSSGVARSPAPPIRLVP